MVSGNNFGGRFTLDPVDLLGETSPVYADDDPSVWQEKVGLLEALDVFKSGEVVRPKFNREVQTVHGLLLGVRHCEDGEELTI